MAKSKFEEMFDRLPSNIKETEVLRLESKKVLAALLELLLHSEARESRVIYAPNSRLRELSGIDKKKLRPSIDQLIDYDLITRKVGKTRIEDEKSEASEYTINFKKLKEPLKEKSFDDLFSEFIDECESLEMPINPTTTTSITNSISTINSRLNSILNITTLQEQGHAELERPSSYKELMDYFIQRMEKECKDKNLDELNEIQESLKDELDSFNEIRGYKNVYNFLIKPSMEKKKEKLMDKELEKCLTSV